MPRRNLSRLALVASVALGACSPKVDEHAAEEARTPTTSALSHDVRTEVTRPDGKPATHVGEAFASARRVSVGELLSAPERFANETVEVEGDVAAMCHHRRAWLALVGDDQSGKHLQVWTVPVFLVPDGVIGKRAVVQGTVQVREVSAVQERHVASEHKLEGPPEGSETLTKVVLQARGAEIF